MLICLLTYMLVCLLACLLSYLSFLKIIFNRYKSLNSSQLQLIFSFSYNFQFFFLTFLILSFDFLRLILSLLTVFFHLLWDFRLYEL